MCAQFIETRHMFVESQEEIKKMAPDLYLLMLEVLKYVNLRQCVPLLLCTNFFPSQTS